MTSFPHFFEKGKLKCWKILQKFCRFEDCFSQLGAEWDILDSLFDELEEYVCNLHGYGEENRGWPLKIHNDFSGFFRNFSEDFPDFSGSFPSTIL